MSLINDALKKAKQTLDEQRPSAAGAPPLQPAEPVARRGFWPELLLPLLLAVVLALAGIFFWRWLDQTRGPLPQTAANAGVDTTPIVRARTVTTNPTTSSASANAGSLTSPRAKVESSTPVTPGGEPAPVVVAGIGPLAAVGTNETTNTTVVVVEPPALKLQGIFYSRKNPTAVINGKIRAVGDRIGGARLLAIDRETVTVVEGGKTNQLTLP